MPTQIVLHPCKIRETRFIPQRGVEPVAHDWNSLCALLLGHLKAGSEERRNAARLLRALTRQTFVGLAAGREDGRPHLFIFRGDGFQADFKTVAARDETFAQRVQCVFRVEQVEWEVERQEAVGDEPFKPVFKPADHVVHAQA